MQAGREIKFRGKPIEDYGDVKWFYGSAVLDYEEKLAYIVSPGQGHVPVEWESVGQFTEVHDDQDVGEELYEGDIVEVAHEGHIHICVVKYEGGSPMFAADSLPDGFLWFSEILECDSSYWWANETKKIGNIHENPELLEVGK
ncbi:YopX family protein [Brevibacillus agri]|uniref:YopX family protein n=1 Tax=Brevibacillus agri TaxID=51101 RepID=UPI002867D214|nr:YopX family protein [Brevibacillus agri]